MTRLESLQKENQALRSEIAELKESLQKVSKDLSSKTKSQNGRQTDKKELSPDRANSVEFMSSKYDELYSFKKEANKQIQDLTAKVNKISEKCERIAKFIEESEAYSYQYNIKIVGVPAVAERETAQQTADLCIKLFTALGVEGVSISDIDTAHRVPSRLASSRPKAIICKFVRRLAKDKVMAARRAVGNLNAEQLQLESSVDVNHISLYDHLTPRIQELLYKSKQTRAAKNYKYCWAKNGFVYLRKTDNSPAIKLKNLEDLDEIATSN